MGISISLGSLDDQRGRLFLWIPVCLSVGIGVYFTLSFEPRSGFMTLVTICCCFTFVLSILSWRANSGLIFAALSLAFFGFSIAHYRTHSISEPVLGWRYYGPIEGTIVAIDRSSTGRLRITLAAPSLGKISTARTPAYVRVSLHSADGISSIRPGARVKTIGSLSPPSGPAEPGGFDFQQYAWFKKLGAVGYSRKPVFVIEAGRLDSYHLRLFDIRVRISAYIRDHVSGQTGAFAAAILTGDRSAIDPERLKELRNSNLAHLLAISGLHMGLLVGFVFALVRYGLALIPMVALFWPTKKIGAVLALFAGAAYLQISGAAVATERAFIMVSVMLIGVLLDRPAITLRAVALAATLLLVFRPESLMQAGFQMSFAATTALVASFEFLKHQRYWQALQFGRGRILQPIVALFLSSFIAGAATAPIAAYHFNQVAHYGLIANMLSVPVMGLLVMPAAVFAGITSLFGLDELAFWVMGGGIDWILGVAHWVSGYDGAITKIHQGHNATLPLIGAGAVGFILWRGNARFFGCALWLIAIWIWIETPRPDILLSDTGRLLCVLQDDNLRALNRDRGSGFASSVWLENDGDIADQNIAAARSSDFFDEMILSLGHSNVAYQWPKKTDQYEMQMKCNQADILIAPNWSEEPLQPCFHITKKYLRFNGSVAIYLQDGTAKIKTARQITGTRLWNTWWLRKPTDKDQ